MLDVRGFQYTAARRRLLGGQKFVLCGWLFQYTAARRRLLFFGAGFAEKRRFNTQPPEGGWPRHGISVWLSGFQYTAARRRLVLVPWTSPLPNLFQYTAARRRLLLAVSTRSALFCFNTQPPEGGCNRRYCRLDKKLVSIHSRPKAAAPTFAGPRPPRPFQYTAARRRLAVSESYAHLVMMFQYTAARRRLMNKLQTFFSFKGFNTQPPEGGCWNSYLRELFYMFQYTAARRRLSFLKTGW